MILLSLPLFLFAEEDRGGETTGQEAPGTQLPDDIPSYVQKKIYRKIWKQQEVGFPVLSACIGDVDGDGLNEWISTDGSQLRIAQWRYGKLHPFKHESPEPEKGFFSFWTDAKDSSLYSLSEDLEQERGIRYLRLESEDLDRDGRDEILFSALRDHQLFSGIVQFEKGRFSQYSSELGLYIKVFQTDDNPPGLIGQSFLAGTMEVNHYTWNGRSFQKGLPVELPPSVDLFSVLPYGSDDQEDSAFVALCNPEELCFFSSDLEEQVRMGPLQALTQYSVRVQVDDGKGESLRKSYWIPRRLLTGDFDRDGRDEVLLIQERPLLRVWGIGSVMTRYMVTNLFLTKGHILEFWDTEPIFGEILDQAVGDVDNDGKDDLMVITRKGLIPFARKTEVLIYSLR